MSRHAWFSGTFSCHYSARRLRVGHDRFINEETYMYFVTQFFLVLEKCFYRFILPFEDSNHDFQVSRNDNSFIQ